MIKGTEESNFLFANNWFQEKYAEKMEIRKFPTFKTALNIFLQNNGKIIVETGTIRVRDDWGPGYSTYIFGDFCQKYDKHLYTVDNNPGNIAISKELTAPFSGHITYIIDDSIHFLSTFSQHIDILYLDSLDCDPEADNTIPQTHQLNELKSVYDKLSNYSIILLDDCQFKNGGKCKLTREFLLDKGWTLIFDHYQSLWIRR